MHRVVLVIALLLSGRTFAMAPFDMEKFRSAAENPNPSNKGTPAKTLAKYHTFQRDLPLCVPLTEVGVIEAYAGRRPDPREMLDWYTATETLTPGSGVPPDKAGNALLTYGLPLVRRAGRSLEDISRPLGRGYAVLAIVDGARLWEPDEPANVFREDLERRGLRAVTGHIVWVTHVDREHVYVNDTAVAGGGGKRYPREVFLHSWNKHGKKLMVVEEALPQLDYNQSGAVVIDWDLDGFIADQDCDDRDVGRNPNASEVPYDGVDQDCDGSDLTDVDGDGQSAVSVGGTDCNDEDPRIHTGAAEQPYDGIDQDCNGADLVDADSDGFASTKSGGRDCNDADATVSPGIAEIPYDGIDNDCTDGDLTDQDSDGYAGGDGGSDCNDLDPRIHPNADDVDGDTTDADCDGNDSAAISPEEAAVEFLLEEVLNSESLLGYDETTTLVLSMLGRVNVWVEVRGGKIRQYGGFGYDYDGLGHEAYWLLVEPRTVNRAILRSIDEEGVVYCRVKLTGGQRMTVDNLNVRAPIPAGSLTREGIWCDVESAARSELKYEVGDACRAENVYACGFLGWLYAAGKAGLPRSHKYALEYLTRACDGGSEQSCRALLELDTE